MIEKQITDNAHEGIIGTDLNGIINYCNKAGDHLLGYPKDELIGLDYNLLISEDETISFQEITDAIISGDTLSPRITIHKKQNGLQTTVYTCYSPIRDANHQITGITAMLRQASEFESVLKRSRALIETAPDAMIVANREGRIVLANNQSEYMFGYSKQELRGNEVEMLIPDDLVHEHHQHRTGFAKKPKTRRMGQGMELLGKRKDGNTFPVEISLSPIKTAEGQFVSAAIRDISERKRAERKLELFNQQLQSKNKELEQFAYIASHDLQEPLRTITSLSEMMESEYGQHFDDQGKQMMQYVLDASSRMKQLIKGLLDYSRLGRNKVPDLVDLNKVAQAVIGDLDTRIKETNALIKVGELPHITGHETELRLLIQNLLTNAIKFRKPDTTPVVSITATRQIDSWLFSVTDNGIGISKEFLEKIFLIFQRLHRRNEYEGTGIGLAHCRKIVEMHGGKIWAQSEPDQGTTFYFTIKP